MLKGGNGIQAGFGVDKWSRLGLGTSIEHDQLVQDCIDSLSFFFFFYYFFGVLEIFKRKKWSAKERIKRHEVCEGGRRRSWSIN